MTNADLWLIVIGTLVVAVVSVIAVLAWLDLGHPWGER